MAERSAAAMFRTPAESYDRFMGRYSVRLAHELTAAAGVAPGDLVLDVGCGPGALTAVLAERAGAEHVSAVEPSEPFAAACRARVPGADVRVASAESLPFGDGTFDVTLAQLVLNFMTDPPVGAREMRRVTRRGGTVACAVWDYEGEMTMLRAFWDAAESVDPDADRHAEGHMPYCTPETLGALWAAAGLAAVEVVSADVSAGYASFEDLWESFELGVGPAGAYTAQLEPAARAALREALRERLRPEPGPFALSARAWIATGRA